MTKIVTTTNVDTVNILGYEVTILSVDNEKKFLATRDSTPMFCFSGETIEVVEVKAKAALESYENMKEKIDG